MKIINLTLYKASPEQIKEGVFDISGTLDKELLKKAMTFTTIPSKADILSAASIIASIASDYKPDAAIIANAIYSRGKPMIGGSAYLMSTLEDLLIKRGITPLYAYSERVSEEVQQPDGSVKKVSNLKHLGFVNAKEDN